MLVIFGPRRTGPKNMRLSFEGLRLVSATHLSELIEAFEALPDLVDLPRMLLHRREGFSALWDHWLTGVSDGFHELDRGLVANRTVRSDVIVVMSERLEF